MEIISFNFPAQSRVNQRALLMTISIWFLSISKNTESTISLGNLFTCLTYLTVNFIKWDFISFCVLCLLSFHLVHQRWVFTYLLQFPHQVFKHTGKNILNILFSRLKKKPNSFSLLLCDWYSSSLMMSSSFTRLIPFVPRLFCPGGPRSESITPKVVLTDWAERKDYLPWPAGNTLTHAEHDVFGCFASREHCWITFNLLSTRILSQVFFWKSAL